MPDPQALFVAALKRAAAALAEAERIWAAHPAAIDALVDGTPYPPGLPSFDEFVLDFATWREAVVTRLAPATPETLVCLRRLAGPEAQAAALQPQPLGLGLDRDAVSRLTRLEVWGTTFAAPHDYTEWRLYEGDQLLSVIRMEGY
jgi:hypothetical protein